MKKSSLKLIESRLRKIVKKVIKETADAGGQIYYHGGNRTDELFYHDEIWLTDEPWYAYLYASEKPHPCIWEVRVDENSLNTASCYDFSDDFDPYSGIDDNNIRSFLDEKNYDGYCFPLEWNGYSTDCTVLKNSDKIISVKQLPAEEMEKIRKDYEDIISDK